MKNKKIFILIIVIILGFELGTILFRKNKENTKVETNTTISNEVENISDNNIENISNIADDTTIIDIEENKNELPLFETNTTSVVSEEAFDNGHLKNYPEYRTTICKFIY